MTKLYHFDKLLYLVHTSRTCFYIYKSVVVHHDESEVCLQLHLQQLVHLGNLKKINVGIYAYLISSYQRYVYNCISDRWCTRAIYKSQCWHLCIVKKLISKLKIHYVLEGNKNKNNNRVCHLVLSIIIDIKKLETPPYFVCAC